MEAVVYGDLRADGLEVVAHGGRYFVRYDAGAHVVAWREDELTQSEYELILQGGEYQLQAMFALQRRLQANGVDPYKQNWTPGENW
jgi:hypothetical protein